MNIQYFHKRHIIYKRAAHQCLQNIHTRKKKNKDFDATSDWLWPQYNQTGYKSYEYERKNLEIKNQKPILFNSIENSSQFFSLIMHLQK